MKLDVLSKVLVFIGWCILCVSGVLAFIMLIGVIVQSIIRNGGDFYSIFPVVPFVGLVFVLIGLLIKYWGDCNEKK